MDLTISLNAIDVPIFVVNVEPGPHFRIVGLNRAAESETGRSSDSLAGLAFEDCVPAAKASMLTDRYGVCVRTRRSMQFEERGEMSPTGDWYRTTLSPCIDEETGEVFRILTICQNITPTKRLAKAAFKDALTGLSNRRGFDTMVADRCDEAVYSRCNFSLAVVDLNGLKAINDTFGHSTGDEAIRRVGAWLAGMLRPGEVVARVGGDEFHLIVEETTQASLDSRLQGLRQAAAVELAGPCGSLQVAVSAGGAVWHPGDDVAVTLMAADAAMYAQKAAHGRAPASAGSVALAI
ncbi:sensor domain-containing diguanylate cyclase [uncultured Aureimonas sp.]|uniref:sensor domain-containing diguanylate cyclase n=1 Tax=uncultured Aureimonas sp. TaxID=1604662 RepID=UPI0025F423FC|nr:sensor domain-containing diguanylate cyclase [uncultured Aureimonas sp.]